jgi:hypothetical protein
MSHPSNRTGCLARLVLMAGVLALVGVVWHSRQERLERGLTRLGGEVIYTRGERARLLTERLQRSVGGRIGSAAPQVVDRLFGQAVAVHFGRTTDLRGVDPTAVVKAVLSLPHLRTVMIDGVPLRDSDLLRLMEAPQLTELGLRSTEVTTAGAAAARARRPGVTIQVLDPNSPGG